MKIEKMNKDRAAGMKEILAPLLLTHPHFMFYCTDKSKRDVFINDFLNYYLFSWSKQGQLYSSPNLKAIAALVDVNSFEYKFHGNNALKLRHNKNSSRIFVHRENVENITKILIPPNIEARVFNIYGSVGNGADEIKALVAEIKSAAEKDGFAVVYETFSRKLIELMESMGFEVAFQRPFLDTRFIQTLMIYNVKTK